MKPALRMMFAYPAMFVAVALALSFSIGAHGFAQVNPTTLGNLVRGMTAMCALSLACFCLGWVKLGQASAHVRAVKVRR